MLPWMKANDFSLRIPRMRSCQKSRHCLESIPTALQHLDLNISIKFVTILGALKLYAPSIVGGMQGFKKTL